MKWSKTLAIAFPALAGVAVGAASMNLLEMRSRPMYRATIRSLVREDHGRMAVAAESDGAHLRAAAHRWAALDACSPGGVPVLAADYHSTDSDFWFTFRLLSLKHDLDSGTNVPMLRRQEVGILCGKVAVALDAANETSLAVEVWEQARKTLDCETVDEAKKLTRSLMAVELR